MNTEDGSGYDQRETSLQKVVSLGKSCRLTEVFEPRQIRTQLYREEAKLPRIPVASSELIGTTSALFLRELLRSSAELQGKGALINVGHIQEAVHQAVAFSFLRKSLRSNLDSRPQEEYEKPAKKRKLRQESSNIIKTLPKEEQGKDKILCLGTHGDVLEDEEDYDWSNIW